MQKSPKVQREKGKVRILLTGGHAATTAIATLEELVRREGKKYSYDIYWIGTKKAVEGKNVPTVESQVFPRLGVKHFLIISGRIQRKFTLWTIPSLARIPLGFIHALILLIKIRPQIILSFGGAASFPVVIVGKLFGAKVVSHEQTTTVGRANRFSAYFADKIALARAESATYLPKKKCVVTGNPVMTQITEIEKPKKLQSPPIIYITGGSRGSQSLNELIATSLTDLLSKYYLIHQTGYIDYQHFMKLRERLPDKIQTKYEVYPVIDPLQVDGVFRRADIVISRSGANTVSDIIASKRPAILIPLPITYMDEQTKNAQYAERLGIARVLTQEKATKATLLKLVDETINNWSGIVSRAAKFNNPDLSASSRLVDLLEEVLDEI
jgi:UDP-N-acetylglucosamine--N-acetylmuramyl-(pentapeptide) pyrophosphoryl-undecaprenol N-acetylglucosamine transferase